MWLHHHLVKPSPHSCIYITLIMFYCRVGSTPRTVTLANVNNTRCWKTLWYCNWLSIQLNDNCAGKVRREDRNMELESDGIINCTLTVVTEDASLRLIGFISEWMLVFNFLASKSFQSLWESPEDRKHECSDGEVFT